jgi:hypothetical protein
MSKAIWTGIVGMMLTAILGLIGFSFECSEPGAKIPREPGTGVEWLKWDQETRSVFVFAYTGGYDRGGGEACVIADSFVPEGIGGDPLTGSLLRKCLEQTREFPKPVEYYVQKITEFCEEYPEDGEIPLVYVLPMLSDREDKSIEEIHEMARTGALFMTP